MLSSRTRKILLRSVSAWLWGRMSSCAQVGNPRCLRRLAIGAQVGNLPHTGQCDLAYVFQVHMPQGQRAVSQFTNLSR
jgi:hypothetical protein